MDYLLLIVGFVLLVKGADWFVGGASGIARIFKISPLVIGLTIVAFGTSAPEAAVSITAAIGGQNDISAGNIVGSNIFNLLVVLGVSSMISPLRVKSAIIKRDYPFMLLSSAAVLIVICDVFLGAEASNIITRGDGLLLLLFFAIFMYYLLMSAFNGADSEEDQATQQEKPHASKSILMTIVGLAGIILGGNLVVNSATNIALALGLSEALIGLTIVSVGTSLPELVTSIVAARKGESEIALGNVVGSNIFNVFFILGISSAISPITVSTAVAIDTVILLGVSLLCYLFCVSGKKLSRVEGGMMTLCYLVYLSYIIIRN